MTAVAERPGSAAEALVGLTLGGKWRVLERLPDRADRTRGVFSVGYRVQGPNGAAFCKALDYAAAFMADDPADELKKLASAYVFERELVAHCGERRLRRVVRSLDSGVVRVDGFAPPSVNYLIFEIADGDCRDIMDETEGGDGLVAVRLAHDIAVGLAQLHQAQITHQDLKPANLLGWLTEKGWSMKLADLGRAFWSELESPHADMLCPGDTTWAAPEVLYSDSSRATRSPKQRQLGDLYSLGSLLCYLFTGVPFGGGILAMELDPQHRWNAWGGSFEDALPVLLEAQARALARLGEAIHSEASEAIVSMVAELCHPDPTMRGAHRFGRPLQSTGAMLSVYVSRLDLVEKQIRVKRAGSQEAS